MGFPGSVKNLVIMKHDSVSKMVAPLCFYFLEKLSNQVSFPIQPSSEIHCEKRLFDISICCFFLISCARVTYYARITCHQKLSLYPAGMLCSSSRCFLFPINILSNSMWRNLWLPVYLAENINSRTQMLVIQKSCRSEMTVRSLICQIYT